VETYIVPQSAAPSRQERWPMWQLKTVHTAEAYHQYHWYRGMPWSILWTDCPTWVEIPSVL